MTHCCNPNPVRENNKNIDYNTDLLDLHVELTDCLTSRRVELVLIFKLSISVYRILSCGLMCFCSLIGNGVTSVWAICVSWIVNARAVILLIASGRRIAVRLADAKLILLTRHKLARSIQYIFLQVVFNHSCLDFSLVGKLAAYRMIPDVPFFYASKRNHRIASIRRRFVYLHE